MNRSKAPQSLSKDEKIQAILQYHQRTKHRFEAYARGPETLDWDDQPNPFRQFSDTSIIPLTTRFNSTTPSLYQTFRSLNTPIGSDNDLPISAINLNSISDFFRMSFGLAGWKQYGPDKWSLRVNPSSGNLHPTELYPIIPASLELHRSDNTSISGVYHYDVFNHQLEHRRSLDFGDCDGFYLGIASIIGREAWKYGERAFRYAQLDCGHALGCAVLAAKALGWEVVMIDGICDVDLSHLLGFDEPGYLQSLRKEDRECPDTLLYVYPGNVGNATNVDETRIKTQIRSLIDNLGRNSREFFGIPNSLGGRSPYRWPIISDIVKASELDTEVDGINGVSLTPLSSITHKYDDKVMGLDDDFPLLDQIPTALKKSSFIHVALKRRSAQRFEKKSIDLNQFKLILRSVLTTSQRLFADFSTSNTESFKSPIDFIFLVHNVQEMEPGIYILPATGSKQEILASRLSQRSSWTPIEAILFEHANAKVTQLFRLQTGDYKQLSARLCCQQAIASDCAFTIGYLAEFLPLLNHTGAMAYKRLHWQAGILAQQVYMMATGLNLAATGIGCYFDDPWHEFLGIKNSDAQFVYQMAIGHPIVDERITNFSGYHHLK